MALNSAGNVLRETNNPPLTNNNAPISGAQYDQNEINIYNDLVALNSGGDVDAYNPLTEYDNTTNKFVQYSSQVWLYIFATPSIGTTPIEGTHWTQVPPSTLAHVRNKDLYLDEGGANEVSAENISKVVNSVLYKARIYQSGTTAPTLVEYINPNGLTIVPSYVYPGYYHLDGFTGETFKTGGNYELSLSYNQDYGFTVVADVVPDAKIETKLVIGTAVSAVLTNGVLKENDGYGTERYCIITVMKY